MTAAQPTASPEGPDRPRTWLDVCEQQKLPEGPVYALGFRPHWRPALRRFLQGAELIFISRPAQARAGQVVVVWGRRADLTGLPDTCRLVRIEDGFLRSVGLGAQFAQPLSWVVDTRGLYYDATAPSDLEYHLNHGEISPRQCQRAEELAAKIVAAGLSKYNVGQGRWHRPEEKRRVILVPGQVESDASLAWGSPEIRTNLALLTRVREANPEAWIVYKPHPDVISGARAKGSEEHQVHRVCDEIIGNLPITSLLEQVDEVHTLTSLTGFEALLRGLPVTCYGMPFYAGWGLTRDQQHCPRRTRTRNLSELVAATLIEYPLYVSRETGTYITPEHTLEELNRWRKQPPRLQKNIGIFARKLINRIQGPA